MQERDVPTQIWDITYTQIWSRKGPLYAEMRFFFCTHAWLYDLPTRRPAASLAITRSRFACIIVNSGSAIYVSFSHCSPSFYYVFNISLSCKINIPSFIGNLWWDLLQGNHLKRKRAFISLWAQFKGNLLRFVCVRARANDANIVRSRNAQCKTSESP